MNHLCVVHMKINEVGPGVWLGMASMSVIITETVMTLVESV